MFLIGDWIIKHTTQSDMIVGFFLVRHYKEEEAE
jgi:hypothetical protein